MTCATVPSATTSPPCSPAPGPRSIDPVGGAHRLLVVLDDQHRVAQVAHALQRLDQAGVVARVQADARLVQHVQHADQARADLRRQPDALRLAAGERAGRAVERQVVQPDVDHELQPGADLLEDAVGDLAAGACRADRRAPCSRSTQPASAPPASAVTSMMFGLVHGDRQRLRPQALAVAASGTGARSCTLRSWSACTPTCVSW